MSQCQVPCRLHRISPEAGADVADVEGVVAAVEVVAVATVAAAGGAVDYDGAAGVVVTGTSEQGKSQTWDWG
jgi:hypothetical protein